MTKTKILLWLAVAAATLVASSCKTSTSAVQGAQQAGGHGKADAAKFVSRLAAEGGKPAALSAKAKFRLQVAGHDVSLSGNVRIKRGQVIRLQLVALGLVEAARMEFTPDYVLVMDRINKQYVKAAYGELGFLRDSGLNFHSLQALFLNELFMPGAAAVDSRAAASFTAYPAGTDMAVMYERRNMTYRWMADAAQPQIKSANVLYRDAKRGNATLDWKYSGFSYFGGRQFPSANAVTLTLPGRTVRLDFSLTGISADTGWPSRTEVSDRYKRVSLDDIMRRLSAL